MDFDTMTGLYRSWGFRLREIDGRFFRREGIKLSSFPPNRVIEPDRSLIRKLRRRSLLCSILMEAPRKDMYDYTLETSDYSLETFDRRTRRGIQRSLASCTFRRPSLDELIEEGLSMNRATLERQKKKDPLQSERKKWTLFITSVFNHPEFLIKGAFYEGRMVGLLIMYEVDGLHDILHAYIDRRDATTTQPMAGLLYTMTNELLETKGRVRISYGMHEFAGRASLNTFKKYMHYTPVPSTRGYILHPLAALPLGLAIWYWFRFKGLKKPKSELQKRMIRLYQGHRQIKAIYRSSPSRTSRIRSRSSSLIFEPEGRHSPC